MMTVSRRPFKACLFDMGNTLVAIDNSRKERALGAALALTPEAARALLAKDSLQDRLEGGSLTNDAFLATLHAAANRPTSAKELREAFCDMFAELPGAAALIADLKRADTRLVVVSNTNQIHIDHVRARYPHLGLFDAFVLSHEIRAMKPEPAFYAAALAAAGVDPAAALFIDDLAVNCDGARAYGFAAHQIIPTAAGVEALRISLQNSGTLGDKL